MKKIISYLLACAILGGIFYGTYRLNVWIKTPEKETQILSDNRQLKTSLEQTHHISNSVIPTEQNNTPPLSSHSHTAGELTTTQQVAQKMQTEYNHHIRKVYLDHFPDDFVQNGTPELFAKIVTALVLRENELIKADRLFLIQLRANFMQNIPWDETQTAKFNQLIKQYGITEQKLIRPQLEELLKRVNIIPPSLAVAMAGVHTNWGKQSLNAPFGQKEWIDGKYTEKEFATLPEAVQAYMAELNTLPIYNSLWLNRHIYQDIRGSLGEKLVTQVKDFKPEDTSYRARLKQAFKDKQLRKLDRAVLSD